MAGDWIKFEHATLRKPEVAMLCNLLGVNRNYCIGMLCEFWMWWDDNAGDDLVVRMLSGKRPDDVQPMTAKSMDDIMQVAGFSAAMALVGWLEIDESAGTVRLPNSGEHNGKTAKNRALDNRRKAESRASGQNSDTNRTREEKRREEIKPKRERLAAPTVEHMEIAKRLGIDCDAEWLKYLDHQTNAKNKHVSLEAGFRNWLKRANEFRPPPRRAGDAKAAVTAEIWKRERDEPDDITGESKRVA